MSPSGLGKFLAGTAPYAPTIRSMISWYRSQAPAARTEALREAVDALANLYPPAHRETVVTAFSALASELDHKYPPQFDTAASAE